MTQRIRHRLLTILLLGVFTSALSVLALVELLSTSTAQRVERARDSVVDEAERLARAPSTIVEPSTSGFIGMRGGIWSGETPPAALPASWRETVHAAVVTSRSGAKRVVLERSIDDGTLVVCALPSGGPSQTAAWAAFHVRRMSWVTTWQWIVMLLAGATVVLVGTTLHAVVTLHRGAGAIRKSLENLAHDLSAPIPRPTVLELGEIADGIALLAARLAESRVKEASLAGELAQNERLAALGRVAAGVAHEVRNPLASIKLRLDLAAAAGDLPTAAEKAVAHASSEIDRLDRLVADLLVVAGRAIGPKRTVDLGALVRARAEALAPWAHARGVTVVTSGGAPACVDADSMARAVDNLLRNAVEASPPGAEVEARVNAHGARAVVEVEDHGSGVPDARVAELFEPFFTTKPAGTGLGLALSRAIARAHEGDVTYARDPRDGGVTRFELSTGGTASSVHKIATVKKTA